MLAYHHIASAANPELRHNLQKANEARAAYAFAAWKRSMHALGALVHRLVDRMRRARRARQTYRELSVLSDYHLKDIGLTRGEIGDIVKAIATETRTTDLTIAELRQTRLGEVAAPEAPMAASPRQGHRPRQPNASAAPHPATVAATSAKKAA